MVHGSALDTTHYGLGGENETRVSAVARETRVLGTSAFGAPTFLHMGTRVIAVLQVQRSQEMSVFCRRNIFLPNWSKCFGIDICKQVCNFAAHCDLLCALSESHL